MLSAKKKIEIGKIIAADIVARPTYPDKIKTLIQTKKQIKAPIGNITIIVPMKVAAPFPPLNEK